MKPFANSLHAPDPLPGHGRVDAGRNGPARTPARAAMKAAALLARLLPRVPYPTALLHAARAGMVGGCALALMLAGPVSPWG